MCRSITLIAFCHSELYVRLIPNRYVVIPNEMRGLSLLPISAQTWIPRAARNDNDGPISGRAVLLSDREPRETLGAEPLILRKLSSDREHAAHTAPLIETFSGPDR